MGAITKPRTGIKYITHAKKLTRRPMYRIRQIVRVLYPIIRPEKNVRSCIMPRITRPAIV